MSIELSFDDFDSELHQGVSADVVIAEVQRVIGGETARRATASIGFTDQVSVGKKRIESMIIDVHHELGCMLYYAPSTQKECLSVADESRLTERAVNDDGNWVGAGHYLENELAIKAIMEFCRSGNPDPTIQWISIGELPENDHWFE